MISQGAHDGVGLGTSFLRHIQRCRVLVHVIDITSKDPIGDFLVINQELELYNPKLMNKTQVVVINKIDTVEDKKCLAEIMSKIKGCSGHTRIMAISAATGENVKELMLRVRNLVESLPLQTDLELFMEEEERVSFDDQESDFFDILTDPNYPGQFRIIGEKIEKVILNHYYYWAKM